MEAHGPKTTIYWTESPRERAIAELAAAQFGVVALWQLVALGLSASAVRSRVTAGRLHRIFPGVYAVGHEIVSRQGRWMAAVLACGTGALLSHGSAAHLTGLQMWSPGLIHVTVGAHRRGRRLDGLTVHRGAMLRPGQTTVEEGIPCTGWARTIIDLAATRPRREVEKALDRAETIHVFDLTEMHHVLGEMRGRAGTGVVKSILGAYVIGDDMPASELEEQFLGLCTRHELPAPRVNHEMEIEGRWIKADFWWPEARLIVEVDGFATHGTRRGFTSDRERDRHVSLNSDILVIRFTWADVTTRPVKVATEMRTLLSRRR